MTSDCEAATATRDLDLEAVSQCAQVALADDGAGEAGDCLVDLGEAFVVGSEAGRPAPIDALRAVTRSQAALSNKARPRGRQA